VISVFSRRVVGIVALLIFFSVLPLIVVFIFWIFRIL
jgi:hypothetical protein